MLFVTRVEQAVKNGKLPAEMLATMHEFHSSYLKAASKNGYPQSEADAILKTFLDLVIEQCCTPYEFEPFHERVVRPFNYYQFGLDFTRLLVDSRASHVLHPQRFQEIAKQLAHGDNVILLANHQTELDPQAISVLLENTHPFLAEQMIFVAGHRVVSDPLAIPFSMGRNLLCIFSKKYIEDDPMRKEEKQQHNQRTMNRMAQQLALGGKCIYVAPSGGRDRRGSDGCIEVASFDPQSIEMFWLMAQKAGRQSHFYPLALATYNLLPPPDKVEKALGEVRQTQATPIHMALGPQVDMENFPGSDQSDKKLRRKQRAEYICNQVKHDYQLLINK